MIIKKAHRALIILSTIMIVSCTPYSKVLKGTDAEQKSTLAFQLYKTGEYNKASVLFEQLAPMVRGTRKADSVFYFQAMTNYRRYDYYLASQQFSVFHEIYGNSVFAEDAAYMEAYCYYMISPRAELDQTETYKALETIQLFMLKYPSSPRTTQCQDMILELREKLMKKSFLSAELYYNLSDYKAAITALNNCLTDFPDTKYREDILFTLLKSRYMYALNSIRSRKPERFQETIDEYFSFISEFPKSLNKYEADQIFEESSQYIEETNKLSNLN